MAKQGPSEMEPSDNEVRALLERYLCPVPFHEVRTRFLGNIASPVMSVSPIETVKGLWGGELPEFDGVDALNRLMSVLVMGLWNRLTRHQDRSAPFRLLRLDVPSTREGLSRLALVRRQEIDGFREGLFGKEDRIDLPERAHRALSTLSELRAILEGLCALAGDESKPATPAEIAGITRQVRDVTRIVEHEMHEVVLACKLARRQMLRQVSASKSTLH